MTHLSDHVTPITPAEAVVLHEIVHGFTYLTFKVIGGRGVICHYGSGEGVQFITRRDPKFVRWVADGWNQHFASLVAKAVER